MKIASVSLLLAYSVFMFLTLFVKDKRLIVTKVLTGIGIILAAIHATLFFAGTSHWTLPLLTLILYMGCAIANGLIMKKPHLLHWLVRFIVSAIILTLYLI